MPLWAASMSPLATWINFESRDSTSSPTYPASVRLVASPMTRGTLRYEAGDLTRWVLPEPLGPISRMLDFSIVQVKVGDDRIGSVTIPGIDDPLEMVGDAEGEPPLGDVLTDNMLVQVGNQAFGGWDRGEEDFLGRSLRRRGWLWNGLGQGVGWRHVETAQDGWSIASLDGVN